MFMPYIGKVFLVWVAILLLSRIGASLVEVMAESYFFKHVDGSDIRIISIYRLARPAGIIIGAVIGAVATSFLSFGNIFLILALVVAWGLKESLSLRDTL